jgi:predicted porin
MRSRSPLVAIAAATATLLSAAPAHADVSLYGTLDLGADKVERGQGDVAGTVFAAAGAAEQKRYRVSPSLTAQSRLGFRGTEPLGGGYAGRFQFEMSLVPDVGANGGDGRAWGRMAWVGLTTPLGEVRLGRQASAMLAAYDLSTLERLGTTDISGLGLVLNNLQTYQDNSIAYAVRQGPWVGYLSGSPNAGVAENISAARAATATPASGQVLGGGSTGAESTDGRGRAAGLMLAYTADDLTVVGAYHFNRFGVPVVLPVATPVVVFPKFEKYTGVMLAAKYKFQADTLLGANAHVGRFEESGTNDPETRTLTASLSHRIANFSVLAQGGMAEFTNFTRGKDTAFMLGADYHFSIRTALYFRAGSVKDDRGNVVANHGPVTVAGGPLALLTQLGVAEVPVFSGAGIHIGGRTSIAAVGLRHAF